MTRDISVMHDLADQGASDMLHRCSYCDHVIPALADEDLAAGLDVKLGLVSDECALICNECTANLIETRMREAAVPDRRR
jgi:hypothetical protein